MSSAQGELALHVLPDTVNGLPLHPLSVHATVVLVPLAALLGLVFAVPKLRAWARWPLGLVSLGAAAATFVSIRSGRRFEESMAFTGPLAEQVERHQELANQMWWMVLAYAALAVVTAVVAGGGKGREGSGDAASGATSSRGGRSLPLLGVVLTAVLVLGAASVAFQTYRVGESGARAVWGSSG